MAKTPERRSPERHRVMLRLLRMLAALSLGLAVTIVAVPSTLVHMGLLGPDTTERVQAAREAVEVARGYGATGDLAAMAAAQRELASAESLHKQGRNHEARHAAERAQELAAQAQQQALVRRDGMRLRAKVVVEQLEKRVDNLEDLYTEKTRSLPRAQARQLFSRMKEARATAAAVVLAWEQQDYARVLEGEAGALRVLEQVRKELQAPAT